MLKRFRIGNFRSLLNVEFKPAGLNLLIGPNNAGKTNLCWALRFLSRTSAETLEMAAKNTVGETWNLANVYVSEPTMEFEIDCSLPMDNEELEYNYLLKIAIDRTTSLVGSGLRVQEESLTLTGGGFNNTPLIRNVNGQVQLLHEERYVRDSAADPVETHAPASATMLSRLYDLETNKRANLFKDYLQSWDYYNFSPLSLRMPTVVRDAEGILSDGRNLGRVFFKIHNENPRLEKKIIKALKELEGKLDFFTYTSPDPESVYVFMEDQEGNRFSAQSMSDGTLRYMAMTYLILAAAELRTQKSLRLLTIIEEPENGLYVEHLKPLLQQIDPSGKAGQFIFTTHSPYFIDLFDDNLDGLHLVKPGRPSSVLSKPDAQTISRLLPEMSLGEMHFREMLK